MGSEEEPVAWLRAQVEARLALAREAAKDTDGHWWRRMADAGHFDDHRLEPVGHLWAGQPVLDIDGDVFGGEEIVVYDEGRPSDAQFDHIAANDPRDTIAQCEADLAILDEHYILTSGDTNPDYEEFSVVPWGAKGGAGDQGAGCVTCHYYGQGGVKGYGICRTVRLRAGGYKYRPGFPAVFAA